MKYSISILVLIVSIFSFGPQQVHAQNIICDVITPDNVNVCCEGRNAGINQEQCAAYYVDQGGTVSTQNGIPTQPVNNQRGGTTTTITTTPQTSAPGIQQCSSIRFNSLLDILIWAKCIIGAAVIPLLFSIAFVVFLWGMVGYIRDGADVKKREESKKFIYWGILGLSVMVGVWGIVNIVTTTFGLGDTVPQLQTDCLTTDSKNPCRK